MISNLQNIGFQKEYIKIKPFTVALFEADNSSPGNGVLIKYDKQPMIITNYHIINKFEIKFAGSSFRNSKNIKPDEADLMFQLGNMSKGCSDVALIEIKKLTIQRNLTFQQKEFQKGAVFSPQDIDKILTDIYEVPKFNSGEIQKLFLNVGDSCLLHGYYGHSETQQSEMFYPSNIVQTDLIENKGLILGILPKGGSGSGIWSINQQGELCLKGIAGQTKSGYSIDSLDLTNMYKWTLKQLIKEIAEKTIEDSNHERFINFYDISIISQSCGLLSIK